MGRWGNFMGILFIASPDINIINCDMAIKHEGKMMTRTNHRIFAGALGAHQQLSLLPRVQMVMDMSTWSFPLVTWIMKTGWWFGT